MTPEQQAVIDAAVELVEARSRGLAIEATGDPDAVARFAIGSQNLTTAVERMQAVRG